ncbi:MULTISPECIES: hypothetical protein [Bacillaceae]|uniref:Uncharacterized protein n=1 Tax=Bacillus infantis NRRL B-14911 TaxID=1367477 RepID=U5LB26_9BACI|nr:MULTISPECIES: hypothetical protein [Bacillus]AGX04625.1 hypothetical protein N288_13615 [Bacillus infantis NRRL B-14911]EAR68305.1 hypothetical protein B14911_26640 [Bacillus sp. NRRL B-14911]MCA1035036.1 hypothetical protein [Bacillus infantis]MDW2877695.1 hypothetical protein [Bacillus infantis]RYI29604.1 hypothetical protein EVU96_11500 [Bacillus infantis]
MNYPYGSDEFNIDIDIRRQFIFYASDKKLALVLEKLAHMSVNITGILVAKDKSRKNFVRLVAGAPEGQTQESLRAARRILHNLGIRYKEIEIIVANTETPAGVPGFINQIYGLLWCRTEVKALFFGEENAIFITVSDVRKAIEALTQHCARRCSTDSYCD